MTVQEPPTADSGYLQKLLTSENGAIGLDQLQRSDLQLLLHSRGLPIQGTRTTLLGRLRTSLAAESRFAWSVQPHVGWAPKREWPVLVEHREELYMFGGRDEDDPLLVFRPHSGRFEAVDCCLDADFPASLCCPAWALYQDRLWMFGGRTADACTSDMWVYDFEGERLEHVPQAGQVPYPREGAATALWEGKLLLYGGVNSLDPREEDHFEPRRNVMAFEFAARKWGALVTSGAVPGAEETVEIMTLAGGWLYVMTWSPDEGFLMYRLDLAKKKWSRVAQGGDVPHPRCEFAAVAIGERWVIHGGYLREKPGSGPDGWAEDPVNEVFCFNLATHTWAREAPAGSLLRRGQHSAVVYRGSVVVAGGDVRRSSAGEEEEEVEEFEDDEMESTHDHMEALQLLPLPAQSSGYKATSHCAAGMRTFFDSKAHSDVVLRAGARQFHAHRLVLASQSPAFDRMFQTGMREASSSEVVVEDVQPEVLEALLKYVYGCPDEITPGLVIDLFRAADAYQIEGLRAECLDLMMGNIDADNAAAFAVLADGHELPDLLDACIAYAQQPEHMQPVLSSAAYLELMKTRPELAQRFTIGLFTGHIGLKPLKRKAPAKSKRKRM